MLYNRNMAKTSKAQREAVKRYDRKTKSYHLKFLIEKDSAVINRLDTMKNKSQYVRDLIMKDPKADDNSEE